MNPVVELIRKMQIRNNAVRIAHHPDPYGVYIQKDIPYLPDGDVSHLLDVYSPDDGKTMLPVIIEIHGGGYLACNKEINAQHGQYLSSKGFHVVNMNYTLCPEGSLSTILNELMSVMAWIKDNAPRYGFDTEKVCLTGDSAGGHFVLLAADMCTTRVSAEYFSVPRPPFRPVAYACSCPEGSFAWRHLPRNIPATALYLILHKYTFDKACVRYSSYDHYMTKEYPKVWFCTTPNDPMLRDHTRRLHEYMEKMGYPHVYKEYASPTRRLEHVFNVLDPDDPISRRANDDMIAYFKQEIEASSRSIRP